MFYLCDVFSSSLTVSIIALFLVSSLSDILMIAPFMLLLSFVISCMPSTKRRWNSSLPIYPLSPTSFPYRNSTNALCSNTAGEANRKDYEEFIDNCFNDGIFNYTFFISHIYDFYYGLLIHIENLRTWIPKTERYLQQQNWITLIISGIGLHIFFFGE